MSECDNMLLNIRARGESGASMRSAYVHSLCIVISVILCLISESYGVSQNSTTSVNRRNLQLRKKPNNIASRNDSLVNSKPEQHVIKAKTEVKPINITGSRHTSSNSTFNKNATINLNIAESRRHLAISSPREDYIAEPEIESNDYAGDLPSAVSDYAGDIESGAASSTRSVGNNELASKNKGKKDKIVKEITRILSKGMSGATESVSVDTLEQLKQRHKQRKQAQDQRAKLYEELLLTAIQSRQGGKTQKSPQSSNPSKSNFNLDADLNNRLKSIDDQEITNDAKNVLQHLQSITSALMSEQQLVESNTIRGQPGASLEPEFLGDPNEGESLSEEQTKSEGEDSKSDKPKDDRPIMRRFKKIKQQFATRRKQLDNIKKLFNVDLALDPKDGSLMGRHAASATKKYTNFRVHEAGDLTLIDDGLSSRAGRGEQRKLRELMTYLRENPAILASVVAELAGVDNSAQSTQSMVNNRRSKPLTRAASYDNTDKLPNSIMMEQNNDYSTDSDLNHSTDSHATRNQQVLRDDPITHKTRSGYDDGTDHGDFRRDEQHMMSNSRQRDSDRSGNYAASERRRRESDERPGNGPTRQLAKTTSTEARLLESLRDRQLMNLARLESIMAEKNQAASNRSTTYTDSRTKSHGRPLTKNKSINGDRKSNQIDDVSEKRYNNNGSSQDKRTKPEQEEVLQHFMYVSPDSNTMPSLSLSRGANSRAPLLDAGSKPLKRFNNWRDVSMTEMSPSQRDDKTDTKPVHLWPSLMPYGAVSADSEAMAIASHTAIQPMSPIPVLSSRSGLAEGASNDIARDEVTNNTTGNENRDHHNMTATQSVAIPKQMTSTVNVTNKLSTSPIHIAGKHAEPVDLHNKSTMHTDRRRTDSHAVMAGTLNIPSREERSRAGTHWHEYGVTQRNTQDNVGPASDQPSDYFSAYKEELQAHKRRYSPLSARKHTSSSDVNSETNEYDDADRDGPDEQSGAIWARS